MDFRNTTEHDGAFATVLVVCFFEFMVAESTGQPHREVMACELFVLLASPSSSNSRRTESLPRFVRQTPSLRANFRILAGGEDPQ